jgi:hypothetical protein
MGMFDYVDCQYPLPSVEDDTRLEGFQTKSFDCRMETFTITKEGHLIHHTVRTESVPEEERPNWGTPRWSSPLGQLCGCMRSIPTGDVTLNFTGEVRFYTNVWVIVEDEEKTVGWYEFVALFKQGHLIHIERVPGD